MQKAQRSKATDNRQQTADGMRHKEATRDVATVPGRRRQAVVGTDNRNKGTDNANKRTANANREGVCVPAQRGPGGRRLPAAVGEPN